MKFQTILFLSFLYHIQGFSQNKNKVIKYLFYQNYFVLNTGRLNNRGLVANEIGEIKFHYENEKIKILYYVEGIFIISNNNSDGNGDTLKILWKGCNKSAEVVFEDEAEHYYTYDTLSNQSPAYKKMIIKNLYPSTDLVYSFNEKIKNGFEYSFVLKPWADVSKIQMAYTNTAILKVKKINGNLLTSFKNLVLQHTKPVCFYEKKKSKKINIQYKKESNTVGFEINKKYDHSKTIIIDPLIIPLGDLTGTNNEIAKDIDYDYNGNIYVAGGGGGITPCKLAKYDANGNLLWVFSGAIAASNWQFGPAYGGWAVEKTTGKVYIGQGYAATGFQAIRLNENGIYDNYISDPRLSLSENWKTIWHCANGVSQLYAAGGSSSSRNSLALINPPAAAIDDRNLTNNGAFNQDIADMVFDPLTNEMYSIFASSALPVFINNRIYKHRPPYTNLDIAWNRQSGFTSLREQRNRPYLAADIFGTNDNSANLLAINSSYLFYWDGKYLTAYNKSTSASTLIPYTATANFALFQGGVAADNCDNVFIGNTNGTIKVLHYNGSSFDDAARQDISITGYPLSSVYDLAYDESRQLLYACGNGFVASIDISGYCNTNSVYSISVTKNCITKSVQAQLNPAAPTGSSVTYSLFNGNTQLASNSTGYFETLSSGVTYSIKAFFTGSCGGQIAITDFDFSNCPLSITAQPKNATCGNSNGYIKATGLDGIEPYLYSADGVNFQDTGVFTPLAPGTYTIIVKDAANAIATSLPIIIENIEGPVLSATAAKSTCGINNGGITAIGSGGTGNLQYSIDGIVFQSSNTFSGLVPADYTITVKDSNECTNTFSLTVLAISPPSISTITTPSTCSAGTGIITANGNAGSRPYTFSFDGVQYSQDSVIVGLAPGSYTAFLKDSNGCVDSALITIVTEDNLFISATANNFAICEGTSLTINPISNAQQFAWSPAAGVSDTSIINPAFSPIVTTNYTLQANSTYCNALATFTVNVNPSPKANAGIDTTICFGKSLSLTGSGGILYQWEPAANVSQPDLYNPTISNLITGVNYFYLKVADNKGCWSVQKDTVMVTVTPAPLLKITNDTFVLINQSFQLNSYDLNNSGFTVYQWQPVYGLDNTGIANPVAVLDRDITYTLTANTAAGCTSEAQGAIKIFERPEIFVPTAFSPNGDGKNETLRVTSYGIKTLKYFTIFNRYGQAVFSTTNPLQAWNGIYKNAAQAAGAYVWIAEGTDFKGGIINKKGYLVLIR